MEEYRIPYVPFTYYDFDRRPAVFAAAVVEVVAEPGGGRTIRPQPVARTDVARDAKSLVCSVSQGVSIIRPFSTALTAGK